MKQASEALKYLLLHSQVFFMADLFTITLTNGTILRYTNCDMPLPVGDHVYPVLSITRDGTTQTRGIEVDEVKMTIDTDKQDRIPGDLTLMQGCVNGTFNNAIISLDRVFSPTPFRWNMPSISTDYVLNWWLGIFNIDEAGGITVEATAASMTQLLNVKFPQNLYYPTCIRTLGDSKCSVCLADYTVSGTVLADSTKGLILTNLPLPNGYLDQGSMTFTSGLNTNVSSTIRSYVNQKIVPIKYFSSIPKAGDTFIVRPGCNKTMAICYSRFNNLKNFRGYPFIPVQETAY